ncbi:MAG: hypothetical protein Kow0077_23970 [Anaerolineae bacterium]
MPRRSVLPGRTAAAGAIAGYTVHRPGHTPPWPVFVELSAPVYPRRPPQKLLTLPIGAVIMLVQSRNPGVNPACQGADPPNLVTFTTCEANSYQCCEIGLVVCEKAGIDGRQVRPFACENGRQDTEIGNADN